MSQKALSRAESARSVGLQHLPPPEFKLTADQELEIKEAFEIFDTDKSGFMDRHELRVALQTMGFNLEKPEIIEIMQKYDPKEEGGLSFDAFRHIAGERIAKRKPQDELHKLFLLFADTKLMKIGFKNLKDVFELISVGEEEQVSDDYIRQMIADFDQDNDGYITEEEFCNILHPAPFPTDSDEEDEKENKEMK